MILKYAFAWRLNPWSQFWLKNRLKRNVTVSPIHYRSYSFILCLVEYFISTAMVIFMTNIFSYIYLLIMCFSFLMYQTLFTLFSKTEWIGKLFCNKTTCNKNFKRKYFLLLLQIKYINSFQTCTLPELISHLKWEVFSLLQNTEGFYLFIVVPSIHGGSVPGPPMRPKFMDAQVTHIKWPSICIYLKPMLPIL